MNNLLSFINAILLIGALQGIILGVILIINRKRNVVANRIMSFILLLTSVSILLHVFSHSNILLLEDYHKILVGIIYMAITPLIFLYVKSMTVREFKIIKNHFLHFLPFTASFILGSSLLIIKDPGTWGLIKEIILAFTFCTFAVYIVYTNKILFSYSRMIKNNYSDIEKINLIWLRIFIGSFTVIWTFAGILDTFFKAISWDLVWILCCVIIFLIGYFGFNQPEIFSAPVIQQDEKKEDDIKKYEKSSLTPELAIKYLSRLQIAMNVDKLFLKSDISLAGLAQKIGISIHHISQIINEQLGMSFYDYINSQRIEEAKNLLHDPKYSNKNIASIGFEVGFNSLSAFNAAFKKFTKQTPSHFRDKKAQN